MSVRVNWIDADEHWPEEPGVYLTYWSDGALETYAFGEKEIAQRYVTLGNDTLLFWAENVQPPEGFEERQESYRMAEQCTNDDRFNCKYCKKAGVTCGGALTGAQISGKSWEIAPKAERTNHKTDRKNHMNINELTVGQAKELAALFSTNSTQSTLNGMLGSKVIIRTYSAGYWFGTLGQKAGNEVILINARRMWKWKTAKGISLSACAIYGINQSESKIVEPVQSVWLEAIEIIHCSDVAIQSLEEAPHVEAKKTCCR